MSSHSVTDESAPLLSQPPDPIDENGSDEPAAPSPIQDLEVQEEAENGWQLRFRIGAAMYSFLVLGLFASSIGVMLQSIGEDYNLSALRVSLIFLINPIGYLLAAYSNSFVHSKFGQRGIAILGPIFHALGAVLIAARLPFPALLTAYVVVSVGTGLIDGSWCAWAATMQRANTISGFLHGSFSVGAAVGPLIAGTMLEHKRFWWEWYYILVIASIVELLVLGFTFRRENSARYHLSKKASHLSDSEASRPFSMEISKHRATWISAAYFLADVGVETAISGWIVFFMAIKRHANLYMAAMSSSGFWAGMAVGRLALGALTDYVGVGPATAAYIFLATTAEITFAAVHSPTTSIVCIIIVGFFMGPLFPSGVVVLTRLLPKHLHVASVSFVASIGQVGGALLPFAIGAVVDGWGIGSFKSAIIVMTAPVLVLWIVFARLQTTKPCEREEGVEGERYEDTPRV